MPQACNGGSILTNLAVLIADIKTFLTNGTGNPLPANTSLYDALTFQHQPDAAISQANPVSGTLYEVLPTTLNVRCITIAAAVTWAITQPTPMEVLVTIDGNTIIYIAANPTSTTDYKANFAYPLLAANNQLLSATFYPQSFLLEGRSVRVQVRVTWGVTQPTSLVCRVKWAKR